MKKMISNCPCCNVVLKITTMQCPECGMELKNSFELSPFDRLSDEQHTFLLAFLKQRGNLKNVQTDLNISYPAAKKKLDELLIALELVSEEERPKPEEIDVSKLMVNHSSADASEMVKAKLKECGGRVIVRTARDLPCEIWANGDGVSFGSDKLPIKPSYEYSVFNVIVDLLLANGGKAKKGNGRNSKLGQPNCDEKTVVGAVAISRGYRPGDSVFDPVFVLAAVLEWAGIAHNQRGELVLTQDYKNKLCLAENWETDINKLSHQFTEELKEKALRAKKECKYIPVRYNQMLAENGGVTTAKQLIESGIRTGQISTGFATLLMCGRLDLTMEDSVCKPEYKCLFTEQEVAYCRELLKGK